MQKTVAPLCTELDFFALRCKLQGAHACNDELMANQCLYVYFQAIIKAGSSGAFMQPQAMLDARWTDR